MSPVYLPFMLEPILSSALQAPGIRHGFFTRAGGVSEGLYAGLNCGLGSRDATERVLENRARVARHLGGSEPEVLTLYQVHSGKAVRVDGPIARDSLPKADAVVTTVPGLVVGVLTADCTPVLFVDPEAKVVAAAHAGWRGAVGGIIESTVAEMESAGARRDRIRAAIGPTISQPAYEVGPEFEAELLALDPANQHFFVRPSAPGKAHFDLPGFLSRRLDRLELAAVDRVSPCTYANESLFFSFRRTTHRAEPDYGRQISAIVVT
jgi:purine-nucleoside/S-methyl-5'-thioadenosine phosphorylase / adenosine deaminase